MALTAIHPGEHLAQALNELGMSAAELARKVAVPTNRATGIVNGQRSITADTVLRLAHFFGSSEPVRTAHRSQESRKIHKDSACDQAL